MLTKIGFENYKGFKKFQEIEIRPITLIIGKNSSGKSSICKLLPILRDGVDNPGSPLPLISKEGIRLAHTYKDLFYKRDFTNLHFKLDFDGSEEDRYFLITDGIFLNKDFGKENRNVFGGVGSEKNRFDINYIGPIRKEDIESFSLYDYERLCKKDSRGCYTYGLLLKSFLSDSILLQSVSDWLWENMDSQRFVLEETDKVLGLVTPLIEHNGVQVHISEVGQGIGQVLPIIVQSFIKNDNSISVLEQPVLHLHPSIHSKISERLVASTIETGQRYIIESHSKTLLLGFVRMVTKPDSGFNREDLAIYYIDSDDEGASVKRIEVDENGTFSWWPNGLFEDDFEIQEKIIEKS